MPEFMSLGKPNATGRRELLVIQKHPLGSVFVREQGALEPVDVRGLYLGDGVGPRKKVSGLASKRRHIYRKARDTMMLGEDIELSRKPEGRSRWRPCLGAL